MNLLQRFWRGTSRQVRREPLPLLSHADRQRGLKWVRSADDKPMIVCDFCGGNCGQCGNTSRVGNVPFSMQRMVEKLHNRS